MIGLKYDVVVFGGGLAGVSSAVNAKRLGKKVLLVEQGATIGGLATQGLVNPFMRFWLDGQILAGEFFQELLRDLDIFGGKFENSFDSEILKIILFKKLEGVDLLFRTIPVGVKKSGKRIERAFLRTSLGNEYTVESELFIDATGDGTFSYLAGCEYESGDEQSENQAMTLMFVISGVDFQKVREDVRKDPDNFLKWVSPDAKVLSVAGYFKEIERANSEGLKFPNSLFFYVQLPGTSRVTVNTTHIYAKTTDDFEVSKAISKLHDQVYTVYYFAKNYVSGFENSYIEKIANIPGIRESRRIVGMYKFNGEDVIEKRKFSDGVIKACYGVDIHRKETKISDEEKSSVPKYDDYYEIPLSSLISKDFENLAIIGRNFSSDFKGHSAARIMPTCVDTGEIIGKVAGSVKKSFTELSIEKFSHIIKR